MAFQQDSMSTTGLQRGGSTSVAQPPGGAQLLGGTSGAATLAPGGQPMKPQAPNQPPRQQVIYTPGQNGPVVNTNTVPQQNLILPSPMTPQPTQQAQVGQYPPPPLKAANYRPAWLKVALARLKSAAQLSGPMLPQRAVTPAVAGAMPAQAAPVVGVKQPIQNPKPLQSPILKADVGTKTMPHAGTTKMAGQVANNQDGSLPSRVDIGRKIRVVNGRMEGHGIDALYDDPEISSRIRGSSKKSAELFPLDRPVKAADENQWERAITASPEDGFAYVSSPDQMLQERKLPPIPRGALWGLLSPSPHHYYNKVLNSENRGDIQARLVAESMYPDARVSFLGGEHEDAAMNLLRPVLLAQLKRKGVSLPGPVKAAAWPNMMGNTQSTDASMGSSAGAMSLGKPGALQGATQNPNIDFAPSGIKGKGGGNAALGGGGGGQAGSIGDMMNRFNSMKPALPRANSGAAAANSLISPSEDLSPVRRGTGTPQQPMATQPGAFQQGQRPQFQTTAPGPLSGMLKRFSAEVANEWREKEALELESGGPVSHITASTAGRVLGLPNLLLTSRALSNPDTTLTGKQDPARRKVHEDTARLIEKGAPPDALKNTVVRLGGTDIVDDLLWRRERGGEDLPWHQQIGGRVWQNPRTGPIGKVLGTVGVPIGNLLTTLTRGPHYQPATDVVTQFMHDPAVTEHELGHAIDFNTLMNEKGTIPKTFLGRQGHGTMRDLYGLLYSLPIAKLWHEGKANIRSHEALQKALKKDPEELRQREIWRTQVLPAGYGSYVGNAINPTLALPGMLAGRGYGLTAGALMQRADRLKKEKAEESKNKK